jgi:hypothetical protein
VLIAAALALGLAGCGEHGARPAGSAAQPAPTPSSTGEQPNTAQSTAAPGSAAPSPAAPPEFVGDAGPVTAADLPASWRAGCPVGPDQLNRLRLSHWGFDGRPHVGTMIVHRTVATDVITVFGALFRERFPIRLMQPVDAYGGSDDASMAADNTSGFNCRNAVSTGRPKWSAHAYGKAIDVNPVENPYLLGGRVLPPAGAQFVDRTTYRLGMAMRDGPLVRAFAAVGWTWGGSWRSAPDYQHFSQTGG